MGFSDTFKKLVGIEEIDDEFDSEEIKEEKERISRESTRKAAPDFRAPKGGNEAPKAVPIERRNSVAGTSAFKLVVIEPKSFDECPKLVDSLKAQQLAKPILIFDPESVDFSSNQDERGFDFGGSKNPWR